MIIPFLSQTLIYALFDEEGFKSSEIFLLFSISFLISHEPKSQGIEKRIHTHLVTCDILLLHLLNHARTTHSATKEARLLLLLLLHLLDLLSFVG
jgi:hypothetical protein